MISATAMLCKYSSCLTLANRLHTFPKYLIFIPRLCIASDKVTPSIGADEWSKQSLICKIKQRCRCNVHHPFLNLLTNVGICTVSRKSAASFTSCLCLAIGGSIVSQCRIPGEYTSGLNRMSNSVSFSDPTAIQAVFTMFLVLSSTASRTAVIS